MRSKKKKLFRRQGVKCQNDDVIQTLKCAISFFSILSPALAGPVNIRVHNSHVSGQRVISGESFFLGTKMTSHLLLPRVVNSVLVTCKIIRPRKDRIARLAGAGVYALTFVRTGLRVAERD